VLSVITQKRQKKPNRSLVKTILKTKDKTNVSVECHGEKEAQTPKLH
jgi:hypothetical protein